MDNPFKRERLCPPPTPILPAQADYLVMEVDVGELHQVLELGTLTENHH